jgi:hypothetical protein
LSLWPALAAIAMLVLTPSALPHRTAAGALHIHSLTGSIQRIGSYAAGGQRQPLFAVRIRAVVCFRSHAEALRTYPDEFRITHFAVARTNGRWYAMRDVRDDPHWMVPFGETWRGRACGAVVVEDPIPVSHATLHSLGNPRGCHGVRLRIKAAARYASKRTIVKCGPRFA